MIKYHRKIRKDSCALLGRWGLAMIDRLQTISWVQEKQQKLAGRETLGQVDVYHVLALIYEMAKSILVIAPHQLECVDNHYSSRLNQLEHFCMCSYFDT